MSRASFDSAKAHPHFSGWWLTFNLTALYFAGVGVSTSIAPVLYPRLMTVYGASEAEVSFCGAMTLIAACILSPLGGWMTDRFGPRTMLRWGYLLMAGASAGFVLSSSLWQLYLVHLCFGVGLVFCGMVPTIVILSNWFVKRRGLVVGLVMAGSSLSGAVLPNLAAWISSGLGLDWRAGFGLPAAALWLLTLPLALWAICEKPADRGQFPDGIRNQQGEGELLSAQEYGLTFRQTLAVPSFWWLALSMAVLWFSIFAYHHQLVIFINLDLGYTPAQAAFCLSLIYVASVTGNLTFSWLSDYIGRKTTVLITCGLIVTGNCLTLSLENGLGLTSSLERLWLFAPLFGLGYGGTFSQIQLLSSESFGQRELGKILGAITFIGGFGSIGGTVITGWLRTSTGSYLAPFLVVFCLGWLMLVMLSLVKTRVKRN